MATETAMQGSQAVVQTRTAGTDLSAKRYYAVKKHTADRSMQICGDGELGIGILNENTASGANGGVVTEGRTIAIAGAAFDPDALLASDSAGKLVVAAATEYVLARAVGNAAADGDLVSVDVVKAPFALPAE